MPRTLNELAVAALDQLQAVAAGQTPAAEDVALVTSRAGPLIADLVARRVIRDFDPAAIPDWAFADLIVTLTERIALAFGRPANLEAVTRAEARLVEADRLDRARFALEPLITAVLELLSAEGALPPAVDGFMIGATAQPVLDELATRRLIPPTDKQSVPADALAAVGLLVAARVAPRAIAPERVAIAEAKLRDLSRRRRGTESTLVRTVLDRLDARGLSRDAVDAATVADAIPSALADLTARRVITFATEAAITPAARPHIATIVASRVVLDAVSPELVKDAEAQLREMARLARDVGTSAFVLAVLERLDTLGLTSNAVDASAVSLAIQPALDDLAARRVITIASELGITSRTRQHLVTIVAAHCIPATVPVALVEAAEAGLRDIARRDRTASTPLARAVLDRLNSLGADSDGVDALAVVDHIQPALDDLANRRVAGFSNEAAVGSSAFSHIVTIVAARVVPSVVPPDMVALAEARLRELGRLNRAVGTPFVRSVLERLEAIGASRDAIDTQAVAAHVQPTLDDLSRRRVIVLADEAAIYPGAMPHVIMLVAARAVPSAVPPEAVLFAEARLREMARLERATGSSLLVRTVLERLEAMGAGRDAIDASAIQSLIPAVLGDLAARRIILIASEAAVPTSAVSHLVTILAGRVQPTSFGPDVIAQAEGALREIARRDRTQSTAFTLAVLDRLDTLGAPREALDATAITTYVQPTLDDLRVRRIVSIANEAAIPPSALPHLVTLVSARAAPGAVPPDAVLIAEDRLREATRLDRTLPPLTLAVLEQLEITGGGRGTLDGLSVTNRIPGILSELALRRVIYIADADSVEPAHVPALSRYIASSLSNPPRYDMMMIEEGRLRDLAPAPPSLPPIRVAYF